MDEQISTVKGVLRKAALSRTIRTKLSGIRARSTLGEGLAATLFERPCIATTKEIDGSHTGWDNISTNNF